LKRLRLNIIIVLGLVAIIGILVAQLLWTRQAYTIEEIKFSQKAHVALLEVVKNLYGESRNEFPTENPVQKIANDYYIVNVNKDFEPDILEYYLTSEFEKINLDTDFEYAMYDCESDEMVYGSYVSLNPEGKGSKSVYFPKHKNLVYYFAVRFPNETSYLFDSLKFWFVLSGALVLILLIYVYSIFTIIQQRKYSELQRDFLNNMTHEFKTPLSSILLAARSMQTQQAVYSNQRLDRYAHLIVEQSEKLNDHIDTILNIARSDKMPLQLKKTAQDPTAIIEKIAAEFKERHPDLDIEIKAEEHPKIKLDVFHFSNVVQNLIDNSIKYSNEKPVIRIHARIDGKNLLLDFADEGMGVPPKKLANIFDRFYRVQNEKSNEVKGFGLGLYYVKKVCILHGWRIKALNNPGRGITISIKMPL
jgi:two-component system phosphate regulon sensor histidine kinase PhoR